MLPNVIFDLIISFVPTRDRLIVIESVCKYWYRLSSDGLGWSDNIDLMWLLLSKPNPTNAPNRTWLPQLNWSPIATALSKRLVNSFTHVSTLCLPFMMCSTMMTPSSTSTPTSTFTSKPWLAIRQLQLVYDCCTSGEVCTDYCIAVIEYLFPNVTHLVFIDTNRGTFDTAITLPLTKSMTNITTLTDDTGEPGTKTCIFLRSLPPRLSNLSVISTHHMLFVFRNLSLLQYKNELAPDERLPLRTLRFDGSTSTGAWNCLIASSGGSLESLIDYDLYPDDIKWLGRHAVNLRSFTLNHFNGEVNATMAAIGSLIKLRHLALNCKPIFNTVNMDTISYWDHLQSLTQLQSLKLTGPWHCTKSIPSLHRLVRHLASTDVGVLALVNECAVDEWLAKTC